MNKPTRTQRAGHGHPDERNELMPGWDIEFDDDGTPLLRRLYPNLQTEAERIPLPGGGDGGLLTATVHIEAPQLATLFSAPPTIVPAPGVGKFILPIAAGAQMVPVSTEYSLFGSIGLCFNNDPTLNPFGDQDPMQGIIDQVAIKTLNFAAGYNPNLGVLDATRFENQPFNLFAGGEDPTIYGNIVTSDLNDGGTGYAEGDTGTIDGDISLLPSPIVPAEYTVLTAPGGVVATYSITNHDPGYAVATGSTTTPGGAQAGGGSGFTIDINSIPAPDGDLYIPIWWLIGSLH